VPDLVADHQPQPRHPPQGRQSLRHRHRRSSARGAGCLQSRELRGTVLLSELGLDGRLRPIWGILPATLAARQAGFTRVIVPLRQSGETKLVDGIGVFGIASITQLVAFPRGVPMPTVEPVEVIAERVGRHANRRLDPADVVGQIEAKWACEVAAVGHQAQRRLGRSCAPVRVRAACVLG
jgi:predicted ATPase with chaperone activity